MRILVTGATGFIGNHLIGELLKDSSNQIIATARNKHKAKEFDWYSEVKFIEYNLKDSDRNLFNLFGKPDQLIHLAWDNLNNYNDLAHLETILYEQFRFLKSIITGGLKDVVITGTCFEYGMVEGVLSEDMDPKPSNSYALAKDTLRKFIIELQKQTNFSYKWIRLFYMHGDGQSKASLIPILDKAIEDRDSEFNMSGGEQLRDFLPINEVVRNIGLIASQNIYIDQPINCCSGRPISIKSLVEKHLKVKKIKMKLNLGYYPYPDYEPMRFWGSNLILHKIKNKITEY